MTEPAQFGKYEVIGKIGEGGFGSVYEGRDPQLKRRVAVKTLTADRQDLRERFLQEAEISAGLQHPNVVTVFDFGHRDDVPYLVQEFLSGEDLSHKIRRREAGSVETRLAWLLQIARGLDHAHGRGVIHRDVKPANVRILDDGQVKILDFGIAKLLETDRQLTRSGMAMGTLGYLPPEQIEGEPVDRRADLFSFGVLAYELLTYAKPFHGDHPSAVLYQIAHNDPKPLHELWPECPPELAELLHRCLAKKPAQRPQSFSEVIDVLSRYVGATSADTITAQEAPTQRIEGVAQGPETAPTVATGRDRKPPPPPLSFLSDAYKTAIGPRGRKVLGILLVLAVLGVLAMAGLRRLDDPTARSGGSTDELEQPHESEETRSNEPIEDEPEIPEPTPEPDGGAELAEVPEPLRDSDRGTGLPKPPVEPDPDDPLEPIELPPAAPESVGSEIPAPVETAPPPAPSPTRRVLLLLEGPDDAVAPAESAFIDRLLTAGMPVVDASALDRLKADATALAQLRGADPSQVAQVGARYDADMVVVGRLSVETQPAVGKFHTGRATLSYRAYRASTGEYLGAGTSRVGAGGVPGEMEPSPGQAATSAAEAVARNAAAGVLEKVGDA